MDHLLLQIREYLIKQLDRLFLGLVGGPKFDGISGGLLIIAGVSRLFLAAEVSTDHGDLF